MSNETKAALASYARHTAVAVALVISTGNFNLQDLAKAALAALLGPAARWVNPNDTSFGRQHPNTDSNH